MFKKLLTTRSLCLSAIIAALYAMQLAWIDYQLKNKKLAFNHEMPPLRRQRTDAAGSIFGLLAQFRRYRCL